eukprot:TRINITY_DN5346_c0_g1_i5.p1 TRINITY_DN5346_c0_g1~~TRINITY_DN5346_c0_g1_i5.p1  ORF type:complete len:134 (-),score=23.87 TRINITY_DN5346_c0_g1_i5:621-1022(-)
MRQLRFRQEDMPKELPSSSVVNAYRIPLYNLEEKLMVPKREVSQRFVNSYASSGGFQSSDNSPSLKNPSSVISGRFPPRNEGTRVLLEFPKINNGRREANHVASLERLHADRLSTTKQQRNRLILKKLLHVPL